MVDEVVSTVNPLIESNGNRLSVDYQAESGRMRSDSRKLRQVLYNLLSNAAKFTENGTINVRVYHEDDERGPHRGGNMVFVVADSGAGIAPDQIEAAFTAFEQTDSSRDSLHAGTGLGLPICRHYCAMMGGTISVDSEPGRGSTFTVRLPARLGNDDAQADVNAAADTMAPHRRRHTG